MSTLRRYNRVVGCEFSLRTPLKLTFSKGKVAHSILLNPYNASKGLGLNNLCLDYLLLDWLLLLLSLSLLLVDTSSVRSTFGPLAF